ncbi:DinB family protein [Pedobacter sp. SYSU D00535]|uniref:DinB family protein n=1 Tax=Pedobacter sp. SYSU D00535 TaxID=2810308 RepID=UPI001A973C63|nr:DinB family protein [Pedobacter sp. SYSU D00535]
MSVNDTAKAILKALQEYHELLNSISDEEFLQQPARGGWSCSEVFCHIAQANLGSILAIEKCIHGRASAGKYSVPFITRIILFLGRLPGGKYKAPDTIASMVKKISREEARNQLIKFTGRLKDVTPKIAKASPYCRVKHPRLGMLNSEEWLRFIEIHTKHHLKQVYRVRKSLAFAVA